MQYYVYHLIDPRDGQPFYVGKGKGNRCKSHLRETKESTTNLKKFNKIQSIRSVGLEPLIDIIAYFDDEESAYAYERLCIQANAKLVNIQPGGQGGQGNCGWKTSNPSSKAKGLTYEQRYGIEKAKWMRDVRSSKFTGRVFTEESRQRMSKAAVARDHSYKNKQVCTPKGTFSSVQEAARCYNISDSAMSQRLKSHKQPDFYCLDYKI